MALPALRCAALRPATHDEIKATIFSRFATFPQPQRDEGETAAFWADYYDALSDCTAAAVEAAMAAHVRDPAAEFLPKPGKLAELARRTPHDGRWSKAYRRAKAAVTPTAPPKERSADDMAAVRAQMTDLVASLNATAQAKADAMTGRLKAHRTPTARVDERGISDEARRLLIRQGAKIAPPADDQPHHQQDRAA